MTVLTSVTGTVRNSNLQLTVVTAATPAVETEVPDCEITVPAMVPPPTTPLMVAAVPTCQKTFLACAPLTSSTLCGPEGVPAVSVVAIWKTQKAFGSP